jgi:hypothetical protein
MYDENYKLNSIADVQTTFDQIDATLEIFNATTDLILL